MDRIGVLTSGGDSPGMNAAIRSVVRSGIHHGSSVVGIRRGFEGLIDDDMYDMDLGSVGGVINRGGTILVSTRSEAFKTKAGQEKAVSNLKKHGIEGMVVVGGDGSFRGAHALATAWSVPSVGVPASIDNDISGTDFSIGFDTAANTALDAIDRIRDTAASHERLFVVEVMGRLSGALALQCAVAGGAEAVLIPETVSDISGMCKRLVAGRRRGKASSIIIVAEGDETGGAFRVGEQISATSGYEVRVSVLGHLQRGGAPTALDRVLASRLGAAAVEQLVKGETDKMVGIVANQIEVSSLEYAWKFRKTVDISLLDLLKVLAS